MKSSTHKAESKNPGKIGNNKFINKSDEGKFISKSEIQESAFIQRQPLKVGASNSPLETEANQMADKVVNSPVFTKPQLLQKKCTDCEKEEVQRKSEIEEEEIQTKPLVDQITPIQRQTDEEEQESPNPNIQTKGEVEEEEILPKGESSPPTPSSQLSNKLSQSKGGGHPIPQPVRSGMEETFGTSFKDVRVHTGGEAVQMNKELRAQAFTHGKDVYFNEGKFQPEQTEGKKLLAHELTHVVQQNETIFLSEQSYNDPIPSLPAWSLKTPIDSLPGVSVSGYEDRKDKYTEGDRFTMLKELNERIQLNGRSLSNFYRVLRIAWIDFVIEIAITEVPGIPLFGQLLHSVINNIFSTLAGPYSAIPGILNDAIFNTINYCMSVKELKEKKRLLKDMMVAPSASHIENEADKKLVTILLDAIGYTSWLQTAYLSDLWQFRIPPEFPNISQSEMNSELASVIISYLSKDTILEQSISKEWKSKGGGSKNQFNKPKRGLGRARLKSIEDNVLHLVFRFGDESNLKWILPTHPALLRAISGRRIKEMKDLPIIVKFLSPSWRSPRFSSMDLFFYKIFSDQDSTIWKSDRPSSPPDSHRGIVMFGRDKNGIYMHQAKGSIIGLLYLYLYINPLHEPYTWEKDKEVFKDLTLKLNICSSTSECRVLAKEISNKRKKEILSYYTLYQQNSIRGAEYVFQKFIDHFILEPSLIKK